MAEASRGAQQLDRDAWEVVLESPTSVDFHDKPLAEALIELGKSQRLNIVLDVKALDDDGVDRLAPISLTMQQASLRNVLKAMLDQLVLVFVCQGQSLLVTSHTEADMRLENRVYDVHELLFGFGPRAAFEEGDVDSVIDLITSTVAPTSWDSVAGQAQSTGISTAS